MYCVPACQACRKAGECPKGSSPALPRPEPVEVNRARHWAPNQLPLTDMPCGCRTIPWPIFTILGKNIETFLCERHGEVKITKAWRKRKDKEAAKPNEEDGQNFIPF